MLNSSQLFLSVSVTALGTVFLLFLLSLSLFPVSFNGVVLQEDGINNYKGDRSPCNGQRGSGQP